MKINSIIWENVKVKFSKRKKKYDWNECMIIFQEGWMTINRMEQGVTSDDHLGVGNIKIIELTPWNLKAEVSGAFDDKIYNGILEAKF